MTTTQAGAAYDTLGRIGTALADPKRRQLLILLLDGPQYSGELANAIGCSRANASNHLSCLRDCGLVTAHVEGRRTRYHLVNDLFAEALRSLASLDLMVDCSCCEIL